MWGATSWRDRGGIVLALTLIPLRSRVAAVTTGLFAHAPFPLRNTLDYAPDPGAFGPESVTWPVMGDVATFVGGIRALLIQSAHPEVVAGVADHSRYQEDPLGRLSRTSAFVTATAFGATPEVAEAVAIVQRAHRPVRGRSHRDREYSAVNPDLAAWVHNVLTDSFLTTNQVFGRSRLSTADADRFVHEQTRIGTKLGSDPLPDTAAALAQWLVTHPEIEASPAMRDTVRFLKRPPLPWPVRLVYRVLFAAAAATIPPRIREIMGLRRYPGAITLGRLATGTLRWMLGASPSWHLALVRVGAPIPEGMFLRTIALDDSAQAETP